MSRIGWWTAGVLGVVIVVVVAALFMEAAAGPTFRAEDYASYQECVGNIPAEWAFGSPQRDGAEEACFFVHRSTPR